MGDAAYCAIIVILALLVSNILRRDQAAGEVRSVRLFIHISLLAYGVAHLLRLVIGLAHLAPQIFTQQSIALLSFYSGLPFLINALVGFTAMSLHRSLAQSRTFEAPRAPTCYGSNN